MPPPAAPATDEMGRDNRAPGAIFEARRGRVPRGHRAVQAFYGEVIAISSQNVEIVGSANDAFRRGDWDALAAIMDADFLIRTDPSWPEQRAYGREAAIFLHRGIRESWGSDVSYKEIVDLGDRVLTRERWNVSGQLSGVPGALESSAIVTFREGLIILIEYFLDHKQTFKAVGLEE